MIKKSYPQDYNNFYSESPWNVNKWMQAMRDIYSFTKSGYEWDDSFNKITNEWEKSEKEDFKNWMKFYQENAHNKYKTAQFNTGQLTINPNTTHVENGGSFVPNIDSLKSSLPYRQPDMDAFTVRPEITDKALQKEIVEKKIQSIIGRLSSAEKLATNPHVQIALKRCLNMNVEEWLSLLQKLKREIQLVPMRTASSVSLVEDLIYKHANQAKAVGKGQGGLALFKLAQGITAPGPMMPLTPGILPSGGQPLEANPSGPSPNLLGEPEANSTALVQFLENLKGDDLNETEDEEESDNDAEITVVAQAAPPPLPPAAPLPNPEPTLEVAEEDIKAPASSVEEAPALMVEEPIPTVEAPSDTRITDPFDQALSTVTVSDIIARLEGVASLFKNRQIARQLSIVDLMMDKTGIAPFFPTLAEAMRSALESNQYCQSRVEEILAKLRGTVQTPMSQQLEGEVVSDNVEAVKLQLAEQENQEKVRKEKRRQEQLKEEDAAVEQPLPIPNAPVKPVPVELAAPAQTQVAPPLRPGG